MACAFTTIGNAIVAEIRTARDAASLTVNEFEAECLWSKRELELTELDVLRVDVAPLHWTQSLRSRGSWSRMCHYQIGIRKRFSPEHRDAQTGFVLNADVEKLITLAADVLEVFMPVRPNHQGRALTDVAGAVWREPKEGSTRVVVDWDLLRESHQFCAWFPLTYEFAEASA